MKFRNKYSIQFKLKCIELVTILGIYGTYLIVGIDKNYITFWNLNKKKLQKIKEKILHIDYQGVVVKLNILLKKKKYIFLLIDVKKLELN